jgi:deglycase
MRIACVLARGFEDSELRQPYDAFRAAGHEVVLISHKRGQRITGKKGDEEVVSELGIADADPRAFDALFIPGGHSPDVLRGDHRFVAFTRAFADKPIFAVCHGPQLLITAGLVRGRTMTAWKTVQVDLANAGANVRDEEVIVDGDLVTSRKPDDLDAFVRESLRVLGGGAPVYV